MRQTVPARARRPLAKPASPPPREARQQSPPRRARARAQQRLVEAPLTAADGPVAPPLREAALRQQERRPLARRAARRLALRGSPIHRLRGLELRSAERERALQARPARK